MWPRHDSVYCGQFFWTLSDSFRDAMDTRAKHSVSSFGRRPMMGGLCSCNNEHLPWSPGQPSGLFILSFALHSAPPCLTHSKESHEILHSVCCHHEYCATLPR